MSTKEGLRGYADGRKDIHLIDPRIIEVEQGFNSRDFGMVYNSEHVEFLKESIKERGIKTPLTVRLHDGKVILVDGECRLRAVTALIAEGHPIEGVPCQSEDRYINEADRLVDQATRNSGKRFEPLELAGLCRRLEGFGWSREQIAAKLSKSPSYISYLFGLLVIPEEVQQLVRSGDIAASAAATVLREEGEADGVSAIKAAVEERREEEEFARNEEAIAEAEEAKRIADMATRAFNGESELPALTDIQATEQSAAPAPAPKAKKERKKRGVSVGKVRQKAAAIKGKKLAPKFGPVHVQMVSDFLVYVGRAKSLEMVKAQADEVFKALFGRE